MFLQPLGFRNVADVAGDFLGESHNHSLELKRWDRRNEDKGSECFLNELFPFFIFFQWGGSSSPEEVNYWVQEEHQLDGRWGSITGDARESRTHSV